MPDDKTVQVTFDPQGSPQFVFNPESVTLKSSGKVRLKRSGGPGSWTFVTGSVKDDTLNEFSFKVTSAGAGLQIKDDFKDKTKKAYAYTVTVTQGGREFMSPDPEIVNDPPQ
jgi:hypothetical protein